MAMKGSDSTAENPTGDSKPASFKVGYGKPPVATRFVRGRSGNPLGRPKSHRGKVTLGGAMREPLMSDVTIAVDGRRRRMLRVEALVDALIASACAGNTSAARLALDLTHRFVPPDETIADLHEALKHGRKELTPREAFHRFSDEERARMSYESITSDMTEESLGRTKPEEGRADDDPSDDDASDGDPPAGSKGG